MPETIDQNKQIPAAAITLASGVSGIYPLIFSTQPCDQASEDNLVSPWLIKNFTVNILRDWGVSIARINLACNFNEGDIQIPTLPNVKKYRGGYYPYVSCEDEIRIFAGYLPADRANSPITKEDLTEYQINKEGNLEKSNPQGSLLPVFWGFIDKEEQSISEKGIIRTLSCRDRMRVFQDTRLISLDVKKETKLNTSSTLDDIPLTGDRIELLMKLANNITGNIMQDIAETKELLCWRNITKGLTVKGYGVNTTNKKIEFDRLKQPINLEDIKIDGLGKNEVVTNPSLWLKAAAFLPTDSKANPRFHIWAERPPVTKGHAEGVLQVLNKTPIEIINHLALTEERPMDFFVSHTNGDYIFGPRSADFSGLNDGYRLHRTYYCLATPPELKTCARNQIIAFKGVTSTLGTYNKFLVVDSAVGKRDRSLLKQTTHAIEQYPYSVLGRDPMPPCRTQIIQDSTLDSWGNRNGAALIVGLNAARRWARDIAAVQIKVLGDPTWYPGEMFQVWNTGIHDEGLLVTHNEEKQEDVLANFKELHNDSRITSAMENAERDREKTGVVKTVPEVQREIYKALLDPNSRSVTKLNVADLSDVALPRYKVRTVLHDFTTKGFFTTIKGSADY